MIRRLVVLLVLLAMPLALLVDGCAAIVGLDESYPLADDGGTTQPDATVADGGERDAAGDATTMGGDGSPGDGSPGDGGGTPVDSGPYVHWHFDETFGDAGVIPVGFSGTPPVIDVDDGGIVRLAYSDGAQMLHLCQNTFSLSCPYLDAGLGVPLDLLSSGPTTVLLMNITTPERVRVVTVAGTPTYYGPYGTCEMGRGIAIDDAEGVTVFAMCDDGYDLVRFNPSVGSTSVIAIYDAGPNGGFSAAARGEGSDVWIVGCQDCSSSSKATYLHVAADGSAPLASGVVGNAEHQFVASDLLAQADAGLLVGSYTDTTVGFFTAVVPAVNDGDASQPPTVFDLGNVGLQPVSVNTGRTPVVRVDAGVNVILGGISSVAKMVVLTVDDQGVTEAPWPPTPQFLDIDYPGLGGIVIGGAVAYGGAIFVGVQSTYGGKSIVGVAKLVSGP